MLKLRLQRRKQLRSNLLPVLCAQIGISRGKRGWRFHVLTRVCSERRPVRVRPWLHQSIMVLSVALRISHADHVGEGVRRATKPGGAQKAGIGSVAGSPGAVSKLHEGGEEAAQERGSCCRHSRLRLCLRRHETRRTGRCRGSMKLRRLHGVTRRGIRLTPELRLFSMRRLGG